MRGVTSSDELSAATEGTPPNILDVTYGAVTSVEPSDIEGSPWFVVTGVSREEYERRLASIDRKYRILPDGKIEEAGNDKTWCESFKEGV